jgi:hypothetical protein
MSGRVESVKYGDCGETEQLTNIVVAAVKGGYVNAFTGEIGAGILWSLAETVPYIAREKTGSTY